MKLHEKLLKRKVVFQGRAVGFRVDTIKLPNGHKAVREYLDHPGAAAIIPLVSKDKILMVQQYRYPVEEITWEIPAGKLDKEEPPWLCIKRELEEETGYKAKHFQKLISFWPTPAFANEIIHIYTAHGLQPGKASPDEDEFLKCAVRPLSQVMKEIKNGKIKDSKTLIALMAYQLFG